MTTSETQTAEMAAEPETMLAILADPRRIPDWAPAFANSVEGDHHSGWRVMKNGQVIPIRLVVAEQSGTVDYLRRLPNGREGGLYSRVLPGPIGGSVILMTLPVLPGGDPVVVAATLRDELSALAQLAPG